MAMDIGDFDGKRARGALLLALPCVPRAASQWHGTWPEKAGNATPETGNPIVGVAARFLADDALQHSTVCQCQVAVQLNGQYGRATLLMEMPPLTSITQIESLGRPTAATRCRQGPSQAKQAESHGFRPAMKLSKHATLSLYQASPSQSHITLWRRSRHIGREERKAARVAWTLFAP